MAPIYFPKKFATNWVPYFKKIAAHYKETNYYLDTEITVAMTGAISYFLSCWTLALYHMPTIDKDKRFFQYLRRLIYTIGTERQNYGFLRLLYCTDATDDLQKIFAIIIFDTFMMLTSDNYDQLFKEMYRWLEIDPCPLQLYLAISDTKSHFPRSIDDCLTL